MLQDILLCCGVETPWRRHGGTRSRHAPARVFWVPHWRPPTRWAGAPSSSARVPPSPRLMWLRPGAPVRRAVAERAAPRAACCMSGLARAACRRRACMPLRRCAARSRSCKSTRRVARSSMTAVAAAWRPAGADAHTRTRAVAPTRVHAARARCARSGRAAVRALAAPTPRGGATVQGGAFCIAELRRPGRARQAGVCGDGLQSRNGAHGGGQQWRCAMPSLAWPAHAEHRALAPQRAADGISFAPHFARRARRRLARWG